MNSRSSKLTYSAAGQDRAKKKKRKKKEEIGLRRPEPGTYRGAVEEEDAAAAADIVLSGLLAAARSELRPVRTGEVAGDGEVELKLLALVECVLG